MALTAQGDFAIIIGSEELSRGLSPDPTVRDERFLTACKGAVGQRGVLRSLDLVYTSITSFARNVPFPQLFVFTNHIVICTDTHIYELVENGEDEEGNIEYVPVEVFDLESNGHSPGDIIYPWSAVDFHDFLYFSNNRISVIRQAESGLWSESSLPSARCICNFNGQVLIGAGKI